ncbi:hypothetical protein B0H13DRAFT_2265923 [Mycena leptocephala]|nr:hypothetical protein B0H13DRAFT_2265923 [Mycena leptocephala]
MPFLLNALQRFISEQKFDAAWSARLKIGSNSLENANLLMQSQRSLQFAHHVRNPTAPLRATLRATTGRPFAYIGIGSAECGGSRRNTWVTQPTALDSKVITGPSAVVLSKIPGYAETLKNGFVLLAKKTEPFLDGTPFKIPISVLNSFIDLASTISDNKSTLAALLQQLAETVDIVNEAMDRATSDDAKERARRLSEFLTQEMKDFDALQKRRTIKKILESDEDAKTIEAAVNRINGQLQNFQLLENAPQLIVITSIEKNTEESRKMAISSQTRKDILAELRDWSLEDDASSRILWLHGPAGAGKSAVAQTLCQDLVAEGRLGASFFFKRGDPSRGEGMKLFPTIAYHLACLLPEFRTAIVNQMENDPGVFDKSPLIQLEKLLIEPSRAIDLARTLVIVIDGLDECAGEKRQLEIVRSIGQGLLVPQLPLRFLIASKPEAHISDLFREPHLKGLHRKFNIHPSFNDIHTYLRDEFARIYRDHGTMVDVPGPWPSQKVVKHLIQKSSGYFIYASTVIKFIDDLDFRPTDRLEIIMGIAEPHHESPLSTLDQLYTQILGVVPGHSQLLRILSVLATSWFFPSSKLNNSLA